MYASQRLWRQSHPCARHEGTQGYESSSPTHTQPWCETVVKQSTSHLGGWVGPRAGLRNLKWEKISWPATNPASSPVTKLTELFWVYHVRMRFTINMADSMLCHLPLTFHVFHSSKTAKWTDTEHYVFHIKGKTIPLQAWTGPKGSRRVRLPDFKTIGTWRW
jgi:hypothetical protein